MKFKVIVVLFAVLLPSFVNASGQTGIITHIQVRDDGLHWLYINGARTEKPSCATHGYWMIRDEDSGYGKSQFSLLLSAYMAGKIVVITGKNTCGRWGDGEDIGTVQLK